MKTFVFLVVIVVISVDSMSQKRNSYQDSLSRFVTSLKTTSTIDSLISFFQPGNMLIKKAVQTQVDSTTFFTCKSNEDLVMIDKIYYGNVFTHYTYYYFKNQVMKIVESEVGGVGDRKNLYYLINDAVMLEEAFLLLRQYKK